MITGNSRSFLSCIDAHLLITLILVVIASRWESRKELIFVEDYYVHTSPYPFEVGIFILFYM